MSTRRPHRLHRERGASISVVVAGVMVALLLVMGLVVDGGAQASARARAQSVASQAARAGADAFGAAGLAGGGDVAAAREAANRVLAQQGVQGSVEVKEGVVSVHTHIPTRTVFLSLIGIDDLEAEATASAELVSR